jgi:hypothetical protein
MRDLDILLNKMSDFENGCLANNNQRVYEKSLRLMQEHLDTVDSQDFIEDHRRIEAKIARRNRQ